MAHHQLWAQLQWNECHNHDANEWTRTAYKILDAIPALCPLEFYTGELFPKWKNQAFIGALAFEEIKRLALEESEVKSEEVFFKGFGRVRDIKTGPEGALYVVLNNPDAVVRLTPLAGN